MSIVRLSNDTGFCFVAIGFDSRTILKKHTHAFLDEKRNIDLTLKAPNFPSLLRVPSGKKKTDAPFLRKSVHRFKQSYICKESIQNKIHQNKHK